MIQNTGATESVNGMTAAANAVMVAAVVAEVPAVAVEVATVTRCTTGTGETMIADRGAGMAENAVGVTAAIGVRTSQQLQRTSRRLHRGDLRQDSLALPVLGGVSAGVLRLPGVLAVLVLGPGHHRRCRSPLCGVEHPRPAHGCHHLEGRRLAVTHHLGPIRFVH